MLIRFKMMIKRHCVICGKKGNIQRHHLLPKSYGGNDDRDNIVLLCETHHVQWHRRSKNKGEIVYLKRKLEGMKMEYILDDLTREIIKLKKEIERLKKEEIDKLNSIILKLKEENAKMREWGFI